MPIGYKVGLLPEARYQEMLKKYELVETEKQRLLKTNVAPSDAFNKFLTEHETAPLSTGCKLADLIRRPQLNYALLKTDEIVLLSRTVRCGRTFFPHVPIS